MSRFASRPSPLALGLSLCLATATGAHRAEAARKPEVAVIGVHVKGQDVPASELSGNTLSAALEDAAKVDALELYDLRVRLSGREPLVLEAAFLGPGRSRLEEGRVLYERADFEPAAEVLAQAIPALEDGSLGTSDIKDLLDALLLLGLARFGLGEPDAAAEPWSRLVELDPNRQLDPVNFPPKVVQGFETVRQQVLSKPKGTLVIDAPDDATVHVDGLKIDDRSVKLPPGDHFVVVRAGDGGQRADRVSVPASTKTVWTADLQTTITGGGEGQSELLYRALGQHLEVDFVLLAGILPDGKAGLQLYEPRTGSFSKVVTVDAGADPVSSLTDGMPTLANYLSDAGTLRPDRVARNALSVDLATNALLTDLLLDPEPVGEVREVVGKTPWYLWAGVAVVAAGGAAGLAIALQPDDNTGGNTTTTDPGDDTPAPDPNQGVILVEIP
jgi:tetratricopeptide (TPR) repeat protein